MASKKVDPVRASTRALREAPLAAAAEELHAAAAAARRRAWAPYSGIRVGAALRCSDGHIVTAANVENASYGLSLCAERAAVARAVAEGRRRYTALAVSSPGGLMPCGACLQVLAELAGPKLPIDVLGRRGQLVVRTTLGTLLPAPTARGRVVAELGKQRR